jgi:hypothetical protein
VVGVSGRVDKLDGLGRGQRRRRWQGRGVVEADLEEGGWEFGEEREEEEREREEEEREREEEEMERERWEREVERGDARALSWRTFFSLNK